MKGMKERVSGFPLWAKLAFAAVCFGIALKLTVWLMLEDITDVASEIVGIEYDGSFFNARGHFGTSDVLITAYDPQGEPRAEFAMDRLVIRPSSPLWLLRNAMFSKSRYMPDEMGLTLENFRNTADSESTPGNFTNLPYDAKGCVPLLLTQRDIMGMGVEMPRRDVHIQLDRVSDDKVELTYTLESPGLGSMAILLVADMAWPVRMRNIFEELDRAPLRSMRITFKDLGFVATRNKACATKRGMTAEQFQAYHMQEVRRRLTEEKLWYGDAALEQYSSFAGKGGELVISSIGQRPLTVGKFLSMNMFQKLSALPLQIAASGRAPSTMQVTWGGGSRVPPPAAANPSVAMAAPTPAPTTTRPEPGSDVAYAAASSLVGEHIHLVTRYGSERAGTLLVHSPAMITIKLDDDSGGFTLTTIKQDVASIRYNPPAAPVANAGKH